jgi:hypothetical protein
MVRTFTAILASGRKIDATMPRLLDPTALQFWPPRGVSMPQLEECCQSFGTPRQQYLHCPTGRYLVRKRNRSSTAILASARRTDAPSEECSQSLDTHADSLCVARGGIGERTPPLGRFQGRSGVVLPRNGRRLVGAPTHRFLHTIVCKSMYTPAPSPHHVSTVAVRIYPI